VRDQILFRLRNPDALIGLEWQLTKWGAMAVTRNKAEEFRCLAQECRATAQTLSTEQARAEMLAMADVCDRVAAQQTQDLQKQTRHEA
jgi:pyruvate-formate lyase